MAFADGVIYAYGLPQMSSRKQTYGRFWPPTHRLMDAYGLPQTEQFLRDCALLGASARSLGLHIYKSMKFGLTGSCALLGGQRLQRPEKTTQGQPKRPKNAKASEAVPKTPAIPT